MSVDGQLRDLGQIAEDWLHHEDVGARLRMAHRCVEWDGWEEGLVDSILGPEEQEEDWFKSWDDVNHNDSAVDWPKTPLSPQTSTSPTLTESVSGSSHSDEQEKDGSSGVRAAVVPVAPSKTTVRVAGAGLPVKVVAVEKEKEKLLNTQGDFCGGRGGELGRRLEAWLTVKGDSEGRVQLKKRWSDDVTDGHSQEL